MRLIIHNVSTSVLSDNGEDEVIAKAIKDYLSYRQEGWQHSEAAKYHGWDGYSSMMKYGKFPTGFLPNVLKLLSDDYPNAAVQLIDNRVNMPKFKDTPIPTRYGNIEMYEHQVRLSTAANKYLPNGMFFPRGIIDAATNAGKTLMSTAICTWMEDCKCIFLVHTKDLFNKSIKDFSPFFDVGLINDKNYEIRPFTIAMYKTLKNRMTESVSVQATFATYFNTMIVDEAHRAGSSDYVEVVKQINAGARYLISGTPLLNTSTKANLLIIGNSGPKLGSVKNKELIETGVSRKPAVKLHLCNEDLPPKFYTYQEELKLKVHESEDRLNIIKRIISNSSDKVFLVSFSIIQHGYKIYEALESYFPNLSVRIAHGNSEDRVELLEDFAEGKINVLIASTIVKEGVNLPFIDEIINVKGGKSSIDLLQICGRGLRLKEGSDSIVIHDFYDVGTYVQTHSQERIKIYKNEGFDIEAMYDHTPTFRPKKVK